MKKPSMSIDQAIQIALSNVTDPYALTYLKAIPTAIEEGGEDLYHEATDSLRIQILYALNNMATWKGPLARETKTALREYCNPILHEGFQKRMKTDLVNLP